MKVRTILTPAEIDALPRRDLRDAECVVFDVLRATSTIIAALANGARRVVPALTEEEAFGWRAKDYPGALLGGERSGVRIDGFDLGNSPREYIPGVVAGRDIITTTTNGTVALRACSGAGRVFAAGLVNINATAAALRAVASWPGPLLLVCAGTGQDFALEDGLAAGALASCLLETGTAQFDDATRAMITLYQHHRGDLLSALLDTANGRRLVALGSGDDVAWCARESVFDRAAMMKMGGIRFADAPVSTNVAR